jgi:hypothetical protein
MASKSKKGKTKPAKKTKTTAATDAPKEDAPKRGVGRPSEYKPEYAEQARKLYLLGFTDEELAQFLGVTVRTIYLWKDKYPEFLQADREGKVLADAEVTAAGYKRATGYTYETEKIIGKGDNARVVKMKIHVPADPTSAQWWMRNRQRRLWGDTKQVEVGSPGEFDVMSQDELIRYIREQEEAIGLFDAEPGSDAVN